MTNLALEYGSGRPGSTLKTLGFLERSIHASLQGFMDFAGNLAQMNASEMKHVHERESDFYHGRST